MWSLNPVGTDTKSPGQWVSWFASMFWASIHLIRMFRITSHLTKGFSGGSVIKNLPVMPEMQEARLGRSPGGGNGNPLQCSCLENPMDGGPGGLQSTGWQKS